MPKPLPEAERQAIIAAFATGKSCGQLAAEFKRGRSTISRLAKEVGHEWGRSNLTRAQAAKAAYDDERRARLRLSHVEAAERLLGQLFAPAKLMKIGGKDNVYTERKLDEPTFQDKRDITQAINNLMRTVLEMDKRESGTDAGALFDQLFGEILASGSDYQQSAGDGEAAEG